VEVVASLSQGRKAAAQCGLFTHKSVPVIFEPPCTNLERNCVINADILKHVFLKLCFRIENLESYYVVH